MGLFDFFKAKKTENYIGRDITFRLNNPSRTVLAGCKEGDYVNLWTKPEMDRVNIYAPNSIGGSGQLGTIPSNYFKLIKAHILGQKDFEFSGPSTNNYDATITDVSSTSCTISIRLFSPEEHERRIKEMIERDKELTRVELEKKYRMSKPVDIKFDLKGDKPFSLDHVRLRIFDKEYYIENPHDYKLQLVDDTNGVIAETFSQKDKVFRVVKAHLNGQPLRIEQIERSRDHLKVVVG
ncbi:hypothetical protein [Chryseolinea sp. H1M3-3]|uniref:hypothetical protein n=1 Tax=Chryseolinea sp. H1M3-3 TaxID=3034144 RepID=UPI0023EC325B|nr:hypothetical protein [Chryseolinea sp. H1M3-3]